MFVNGKITLTQTCIFQNQIQLTYIKCVEKHAKK